MARRRKRLKRFLAGTVLLLGALAAAAGWAVTARYRGPDQEAVIDVPRGASTREIAGMLQGEGVIQYSWQFYVVRLFRFREKLQAGEYVFDAPISAWNAYSRIARGEVHFYEVTFPEGSNVFDMAEILERGTRIRGEDFRRAAADATLIQDLAPGAPSLEGYLFPATYRVTKHTSAAQLIREMTGRFRRAWKQVNGSGEVHRLVTLASLVERETAKPEERPMVASVFVNRLDRNMKLDCDPTTIYAARLAGRYRGTIYKSDLADPSPYNTYQHAGLPPGPIANPGEKSLEAALHPAKTEFIYFVAKPDGSGGHVFSKNVEEHNRAVADYRRGQQKGKAPEPAPPVSRGHRTPGD